MESDDVCTTPATPGVGDVAGRNTAPSPDAARELRRSSRKHLEFALRLETSSVLLQILAVVEPSVVPR